MSARDHEQVQAVHPPNCGCLYHRQERAVAAAKAQAATSEPAPKPGTVADVAVETGNIQLTAKVEPKAVKLRKAREALAVVTNTAVTNAARQSRWRSKQDVVALRGQARERMKGLRARRKAGKAVGS